VRESFLAMPDLSTSPVRSTGRADPGRVRVAITRGAQNVSVSELPAK
jgi:hypothetical protein